MRIFLTDQSNRFDLYLSELKNKKVMSFDRKKLKEVVTITPLQTSKKLNELDLDFLFNYSIFPSAIMTFRTQWSVEGRKMEVGDNILQQVFIPPIRSFSQKIIFGVRIKTIIREPTRIGFSYETLEGHVERGESVFTIEEGDSLIFKIQSFSEPGNWFTKILGAVFSVPYQAYCTKKAMENVKRSIESKIYP